MILRLCDGVSSYTHTRDFLSISIFVTPISFLLWLGVTGEQKESYLGEDHEGAGAMETTWKAPKAAAGGRGRSAAIGRPFGPSPDRDV